MDVQEEISDSSVKIREFSPDYNVGLDSLPHQIVKLRTQQGFVFNILLVGETGIGKSTLIGSLFNLDPNDDSPDVHDNSEVTLKRKTYKLLEKEINLKLTVVETAGYGDQINRQEDIVPIISYIEGQFEKYFQEELKLKRQLDCFNDTRIHACLYFICPTGHSLKSIDLFSLKQLNDKVNIIPIIAKSDCLSRDELRRFKMSVKEELETAGIRMYCFPTDEEEVAEANQKSNGLIPFAVAASGDYAKFENGLKRARVFPWGIMQVENEEHNEFLALKHALIGVNMEDMKEKTHTVLYEIFRRARMTEIGFPEDDAYNLQEFYQRRRDEMFKEMEAKEKKLQEAYIEKVKAKEDELQVQENLLYAKYNAIFEKIRAEQQTLMSSKNSYNIVPPLSNIKVEK